MGKICDEKIIMALIATPTIRAAARSCGCSESLIYSRMREREFKAKYDMARLEMLERYSASLEVLLGSAVGTLAEVNANKFLPAQTRLNAADAIFRNCLRLEERLDVVKRMDALEEAIKRLEENKK